METKVDLANAFDKNERDRNKKEVLLKDSELTFEQKTDIVSKMEVLRAEEEWQRAGAYSVRIQGMNRQHHIPLRYEFDEYDGDGTRYIVLLDDGYPIGTCRFYEIDPKTVMLGRVVVLPEYRGRNLGIQVIQEAEQWIKELGYRCIEIESRVEVVGFYQRLGFCKQDEDIIEGDTFRCLRMSKSLSISE